ncbi:methionine--tRNA ligase [Porcincola intestinalis]|uniref:methionine--tRNA ligase n=1 Tax=Porcincola intestinalis TaxID=2606632 RepID=UPI0023F3511E|nr:methionine--tRNA ligase [Porcincola intestinalis]MCI6766780.1 methionine--tRNA ligase [Lachnospiraceae bacterium]MDD7061034.1 methionine--tRNA ligase [Porcincola intestinalis]MDY5284054.1 methionine--tRNA ligase [Porcincola intestinalis]
MAEKKPYYITTAIAYASGKPHIGNTYEAVLADSIARRKRQEGYDVVFQTGTDEHGQKNENKAKEEGITPQELVDRNSAEIKRIWDLMNTSYDRFIRTTDPVHEKKVQKIFRKLYDQGDIYKGFYEGWYCEPDESFFTESQVKDGRCPDCGRPLTRAKEEAYFFRMSKYAQRLIDYINTHPDFIQPVSRKNEMMNNFLLPGLQDLCVSRTSFSWGIPVDFDPKHVVYVWLDALTNYITFAGYDVDGSTEEYKRFWPADLHLIGKDIIRFHTIYWPIFLMALGEPLPKQVFGHPWLLMGDGKMSKSKGNVLYADELVEFFGVDAVRYFVLHEMPFENDGVITWELMVERLNSDLANTLGNLVKRTISMTNKYFGGVVTHTGVTTGGDGAGVMSEGVSMDGASIDEDLKKTVLHTAEIVQTKMDGLRVADSITEIFNLFKRCNKYIDETAPWVLAKSEETKPRLAEVLYNLTESIAIGAELLEPFMPDTSGKILSQLHAEKRGLERMDTFGLYPSGNKVTEDPETLFMRRDLKEVMAEVEKRHPGMAEAEEKAEEAAGKQKAEASGAGGKIAAGKTNDAGAGVQQNAEGSKTADSSAETGAVSDGMDVEPKAEISIEEFDKLQIQVGEIVACEEVKKSRKLLCSQVKIGTKTRQILSGIKQWYKPEEMVGKKVLVITNLKPAKLAGMVSEGMILCAEDDAGNLSLVNPEKAVKVGAEIR